MIGCAAGHSVVHPDPSVIPLRPAAGPQSISPAGKPGRSPVPTHRSPGGEPGAPPVPAHRSPGGGRGRYARARTSSGGEQDRILGRNLCGSGPERRARDGDLPG